MKYRAEVFIKGAVPQKLYRNTLAGAERIGIKELTDRKPGEMSCWPVQVVLSKNEGEIDGNTSRWEEVKRIQYDELTNDQHHWRQREEKHNS